MQKTMKKIINKAKNVKIKQLPTLCSVLLVGTVLLANPSIAEHHSESDIAGYTYGSEALKTSPFSLAELDKLKATLLFSEDDAQWLRKSREVLEPQADKILDTWYGFVGGTPHLLTYFSSRDGVPDGQYLSRVRARFKQWILDTADANYDQDWLNYQYEIGLRHHRKGKNRVDNAKAVKHIHGRYVLALTYPVVATLKPFLQNANYSPEEVEKIHQAWLKSVLMQTILWIQPYVKKGDF